MTKLTILAAVLLSTLAHAECVCRCVDGVVRPLCTSALDLPPLCGPQSCPLLPQSLAPLQVPQIPPMGTHSCQQVKVLNPSTGRYEWSAICR